jgi:hypothetical protein
MNPKSKNWPSCRRKGFFIDRNFGRPQVAGGDNVRESKIQNPKLEGL